MSKKKSAPKTPPLSRALPLCGVDSHAHLDSKEYRDDLAAVLDLARRCGVARVGQVFLGPEEYAAGRHLFDAYPQVFFILGLHPCDGRRCTPEALEAMRRAFVENSRLRAVGEIGLDFYWDDCPPDIQRAAFLAQLELARQLEKPVVVHCREAVEATLDVLENNGFRHYPLLWHCFGGHADLAARLVDNGWHVSFPGPVTYPANASLRDAARRVPLDRLLLETDCPYLSPADWRGKRNEPAFAVFTAARIAEERGMPAADLWEQCGRNAALFFGLENEAKPQSY